MTNALAPLPESADRSTWSTDQTALMESLGLKGEKNVKRNGQWTKVPFEAPQSIVQAFLYQCQRTGLDPVARQIYCIERGGKWGIQASIDGFRLIAEWSKEYAGQTPVQWTADGKTWVDVWLDPSTPPAAARVGIYRRGFTEPLWAVATYQGYVPRDRDGSSKPTGQWSTNPSNQLGKCAEMLGLRKAFPQDLSGIYGTEEMDQASRVAPEPARAQKPVEVQKPSEDWAALADQATSVDQLKAVYSAASEAGELGLDSGREGLTVTGYVAKRKHELLDAEAEPTADEEAGEVVDAVVVPEDGEPVTSWPTVEPGSGLAEQDPEA